MAKSILQQVQDYKRNDIHRTLLFWSGPFSQWEHAYMWIDGVCYNCCEQYMMAKKAEIFGDHEMLELIMAQDGEFVDQRSWIFYPKEQKRLGRLVKNFDPVVWNAVARPIVFRANLAKFAQNPDLGEALLSTENYRLVEASPYDKIWGIGMSDNDNNAFNPRMWKGLNWLGDTLTEVRNSVRLFKGV